MQHVAVGYLDHANQLKAIRAAGDVGVGVANFSACQDVLGRLDKTFAAFFRRLQAGDKPRLPALPLALSLRLAYLPVLGRRLRTAHTGRLYLHGVREVKLKWHRAPPAKAKIKTVTAKREARRWYVCFSVEMAEPDPLPASDLAVGIDVGLTTFAALSDGKEIANPRHFRAAERRLRIAQLKLARRKKRSRRRQKARQELARFHLHIANQRRDFHHKTAHTLVQEYGLIGVEDLNTKGLAGSILAKSVRDAGGSQFIRYLTDKAACAGRIFVAVNPAGTTQDCSSCGAYVPNKLSDRWHSCACGLSISRT